ncbi:retrovirus-related pol polyprotein from transposon TNT 1-94 [Tanacetum coccineum]
MKEYECLANELSKQKDNVCKNVYIELLRIFAKLEKHAISLELTLQQCQKQIKNDQVWKQKESSSFRDQNEQYFEIQNLKAQLQDRNIAINELKKLIEKLKGKSVDTKFDKPSVARQRNALRIPKPSVLVTTQILPKTARKAVRNTNVIKLGMHRIDTRTTQTRAPQLPQTSRNTNSRVSTSTGVIHRTSVSRPQLRSTQMKEKVMHNNGQVKSKKPQAVPIRPRKPIRKANQSVTTPLEKTVASDFTIQKSKSYYMMLYEKTSKALKWWIEKQCPSGYKWVPKTKMKWVPKVRKENVNTSISPTIDNASRITNVLKLTNTLRSNLSKVPSSSNSLEDCATHPIHYLEVAFRKSTCFVRDLQGNDLLTGNHGSDLYTIHLQETSSPTPICFLAKASPTQAWLWHRILSHLNFDTINLLSKKDIMNAPSDIRVFNLKGRLNLLHRDLCGPMRIENINGKKYILNGVVERQNHTLVKAARTMLSTSKLPLFFWAEAITSACYTQNKSLIIPRYEKTPYHIINDRKPSIKHIHIFGCTCYITRDGENLDKMKEKKDLCILVGYYTQSKGYRVYNKRTRLIVESIHINFDEIKELSKASNYDNSGPVPPLQKTSDHNRLELGIQDHNNEPSSSNLVPIVSPPADTNAPSLQELDLLFSLLYDEFFTVGNTSVSKSSSLSDNSVQQDTPPPVNVQPKIEPITPTTAVHAEENNNNLAEDARFEPYEFINPFCTPVQELAKSSSRNVDNPNMHTFYQLHQSEHRWTKDHPLEQVHQNPSKPVQTR